MGANKREPAIYIQKMSNNQAQWLAKQYGKLSKALQIMGKSILATARVRVPKGETKDLVDSGRVKVTENGVVISFGDENVKYAGYQERGMRYKGEPYTVKHYSTPNTGKHYLKDAGEKVVKEGLDKWLRSAF